MIMMVFKHLLVFMPFYENLDAANAQPLVSGFSKVSYFY